MMNRRQVLCTAAAAAVVARVRGARAATYDLVIKGGRVIDPSVGLDGVRDVAIAAGRIAAVEAGIMGDAAETIDARGKIVTPGLIDIHTHAGRGKDSAATMLQDGDHQRGADVRVVQRPRHAQHRSARGCRDHGTAGWEFRIPRQLRRQAHWPPAPVPGRDRAGRQARAGEGVGPERRACE